MCHSAYNGNNRLRKLLHVVEDVSAIFQNAICNEYEIINSSSYHHGVVGIVVIVVNEFTCLDRAFFLENSMIS